MEFLPRPCDNTIVIVPLTRSIRGQWWTNKHTERKQQRDITQGCEKLFRPKKRPLWKINQTRNILRLRVDRISYFSDVTAENPQEKSENWGKFEISTLEMPFRKTDKSENPDKYAGGSDLAWQIWLWHENSDKTEKVIRRDQSGGRAIMIKNLRLG